MICDDIREALEQEFPDGATIKQLAESLNTEVKRVRFMISGRHMPDAYIDRWDQNNEAVWVCAEIPSDCPPPERGRARGGRLLRK